MDSHLLNQAALVAAAISAIASLSGVFIGALLAWFREFLSARRMRADHAGYLAIRVVCILDQYVKRCAEVVDDDGLSYGQRNKDGFLEPQVQTPDAPKFPEDLDWKSIDHTLTYKLLSMPNAADAADGRISFTWDYIASPPDFEEYFEERQDQYAKLGLAAFEITESLRKTYKLPSPDYREWNPIERLTEARQKIENYRKRRYERIAASEPPPPPQTQAATGGI